MEVKRIKEIVKEGYGRIAEGGCSCSCCTGQNSEEEISRNIGYTNGEMEAVPEGANLGLGCGNPVALASLKEGETVLDLGSGAGFDSFLAANIVGKNGKVIGVDMTPEMISKANNNAIRGGYLNVEFKQGDIEDLPVSDGSVDAIISNCVINLSTDKERVFREAFRVLRPGGRMMISDIVLLKELPDHIKDSVTAYVGCISGAILKPDYIRSMVDAGFTGIEIMGETPFPLDLMENDPTARSISGDPGISPEKIMELEGSVVSIKIMAHRMPPKQG